MGTPTWDQTYLRLQRWRISFSILAPPGTGSSHCSVSTVTAGIDARVSPETRISISALTFYTELCYRCFTVLCVDLTARRSSSSRRTLLPSTFTTFQHRGSAVDNVRINIITIYYLF